MRRTFKGFKRKKGGYRQFINEILMPANFICNKKTFPTRKDAKIALKNIHLTDIGDGKKPIRSYECSRCSGWHLTSLTVEEYEDKKYNYESKTTTQKVA